MKHLLCFAIICFSFLIHQEMLCQNQVGDIKLDLQNVEWNGNNVAFDTIVETHLEKGENLLMIYQNETIAYLVQFIYRRSSSTLKLSIRTIVEMANGDRFYSKLKKETFKTTENGASTFFGNSNETVTYNKKTLSKIHVNFNYSIK